MLYFKWARASSVLDALVSSVLQTLYRHSVKDDTELPTTSQQENFVPFWVKMHPLL